MIHFDIHEVKVIIEKNHIAYGDNFAKGDPTQFAKHYSSDACIFPTNLPKMCGHDAINIFFEAAYKIGIRYIKLTSNEVLCEPELADLRGRNKQC